MWFALMAVALRRGKIGRMRHITRWLSTVLLAGAMGAALEEYTRLAFSSWLSMCSTSPTDVLRTVRLYVELLPLSVAGTLGAAFIATALVLRSRDARAARRVLAAHIGCGLAMPITAILCVSLPALQPSGFRLVMMFAGDFAVATAIAAAIAPRAGVEPATPRLGGECSIH